MTPDIYTEQAREIVDQAFNEFAECKDGVDVGAISLIAEALRRLGQERNVFRDRCGELTGLLYDTATERDESIQSYKILQDWHTKLCTERDELKSKLAIAIGLLGEAEESICEHHGAKEFHEKHGRRYWCSPCSSYVRTMDEATLIDRVRSELARLREGM